MAGSLLSLMWAPKRNRMGLRFRRSCIKWSPAAPLAPTSPLPGDSSSDIWAEVSLSSKLGSLLQFLRLWPLLMSLLWVFSTKTSISLETGYSLHPEPKLACLSAWLEPNCSLQQDPQTFVYWQWLKLPLHSAVPSQKTLAFSKTSSCRAGEVIQHVKKCYLSTHVTPKMWQPTYIIPAVRRQSWDPQSKLAS